jgi:peptidylprolyl isomerase
MKQNLVTVYVVIVGIALVAILAGTAYAFTLGNSSDKSMTSSVANTDSKLTSTDTSYNDTQNKIMDTQAPKSTPSPLTQLIKEDVVVGTGAEAKAGDKISVHYTAKLLDGTVFDSSVTRGQPFEFTLGAGMVIEGWDKGFDGMKVGGKRKLHIPSAMAYGSRGAGGVIKPNSDLIFDVELLGVN